MQNFTQNILLIGNHASLHLEVFLENSNLHKFTTLKYKSKDPFDENSSDQIVINGRNFKTENDYDLSGLIKTIKNCGSFEVLSTATLLIGDPSELLYQAFLYCLLNEDPIDFKRGTENIEFTEKINLFLYPVGIAAQDVRKELSNLMYCLKKHEMPTYLIRKDEKDLDSLFKILLNSLSFMSIMDLEDQLKGIEHLVSPRMNLQE